MMAGIVTAGIVAVGCTGWAGGYIYNEHKKRIKEILRKKQEALDRKEAELQARKEESLNLHFLIKS